MIWNKKKEMEISRQELLRFLDINQCEKCNCLIFKSDATFVEDRIVYGENDVKNIYTTYMCGRCNPKKKGVDGTVTKRAKKDM